MFVSSKFLPPVDNECVIETETTTICAINTNVFDFIGDKMVVKEQPKPDQRARYESDGKRFLPDSKKHPMSITVCFQNISYQILYQLHLLLYCVVA